MEERYQERWDIHMIADDCWNLERHKPITSQNLLESLAKRNLLYRFKKIE